MYCVYSVNTARAVLTEYTPRAGTLRRGGKFGIVRSTMCDTSNRQISVGLLGLALIVLLVVAILAFGRKPADRTTPPSPAKSVTTNTVAVVTPPASNAAARVCATNVPPPLAERRPEPSVRPVPATTNAVAPKAAVRKIEYDPTTPKNRQVLLARRRIVVASGRKFPKRFCMSQTMTARKTAPYVLLSEAPVDRSVHSQAMANGARVAGFLPNNALLIEADETALKNLSEDPAFLAAVEYEPLDKLQPLLLESTNETVEASVVLMNAAYLDAMRDFVTAHGGLAAEAAKNNKSFAAVLPRKLVTDLARKGEVRWIGRRAR